MKLCTFPECGRKHLARGLCKVHYNMWIGGKAVVAINEREPYKSTPCAAPECKNSSYCKGYCNTHYQRVKKYGSTELPLKIVKPRKIKVKNKCSVYECDSMSFTKGMCSKHYERHKRHGDTEISYRRKYRREPIDAPREESKRYITRDERECLRMMFKEKHSVNEDESIYYLD